VHGDIVRAVAHDGMDVGIGIGGANLPQQPPEQRLASEIDQAFGRCSRARCHSLAHAGGQDQVAHREVQTPDSAQGARWPLIAA
jgi:hypothetical protein